MLLGNIFSGMRANSLKGLMVTMGEFCILQGAPACQPFFALDLLDQYGVRGRHGKP